MSLQIVTPNTSEPVTLADTKAVMRLDASFTGDDTLITGLIVAAREFAEKITRRSLVPKAYALYRDRFPHPHEPLSVPAPPLLSIMAVKYTDPDFNVQTWDPSEYHVGRMQSPGVILPVYPYIYPSTANIPDAVEVDFTAGYGASGGPTLPAHLALAIKMLAGHFYDHPEAVSADNEKELPLGLRTLLLANRVYVF